MFVLALLQLDAQMTSASNSPLVTQVRRLIFFFFPSLFFWDFFSLRFYMPLKSCFPANALQLIGFIWHVVCVRRRFQSSPDMCRVRGLIYGNNDGLVSIAQCAFCVIRTRCFSKL